MDGRGVAAPPVFRDFHPFSLKFEPQTVKSQIIFNILPPQFLGCPLSFKEVVTPLSVIKIIYRIVVKMVTYHKY